MFGYFWGLVLLWYVELFIQALRNVPPLCGYYKYAFTLILNFCTNLMLDVCGWLDCQVKQPSN
jgi:hypothetical protein